MYFQDSKYRVCDRTMIGSPLQRMCNLRGTNLDAFPCEGASEQAIVLHMVFAIITIRKNHGCSDVLGERRRPVKCFSSTPRLSSTPSHIACSHITRKGNRWYTKTCIVPVQMRMIQDCVFVLLLGRRMSSRRLQDKFLNLCASKDTAHRVANLARVEA